MQRLRVTFGRDETTKYISHLDMMRFWERAFRRAHLSVALSQGFHPHPRFALAAPLPVGVTSEGELMDVFLTSPTRPAAFFSVLSEQMVSGIELIHVEEVDRELSSLQSLMRYAEYRVTVESSRPTAEVEEAVSRLLAAGTLSWEHLRDGELRHYDLRRQIDALGLEKEQNGRFVLYMRLQADSSASGRPEQVARALEFLEHPLAIHRVRLILADAKAAMVRLPSGKEAPSRHAPHTRRKDP